MRFLKRKYTIGFIQQGGGSDEAQITTKIWSLFLFLDSLQPITAVVVHCNYNYSRTWCILSWVPTFYIHIQYKISLLLRITTECLVEELDRRARKAQGGEGFHFMEIFECVSDVWSSSRYISCVRAYDDE